MATLQTTELAHQLQRDLQALQNHAQSASAFAQTWALQSAHMQSLLATLPGDLHSRFAAVWQDLLNRLETSAAFSEESCSFSQGDLWASLQMWLDKWHLRSGLSPTPTTMR